MWLSWFSALPAQAEIRVSAGRAAFLPSEGDSRCWQNSVLSLQPQGCSTEVPISLMAVDWELPETARGPWLTTAAFEARSGGSSPPHTLNLPNFSTACLSEASLLPDLPSWLLRLLLLLLRTHVIMRVHPHNPR